MKNDSTARTDFENLFRENYLPLYYYALDWLEDEEAAKDIVSCLFGDLWAQYDRWHPDNPKSYLARAVRNRCLNYLKHRAVERKSMQTYIEEKLIAISPDAYQQDERMQLVQKTMEQLPPKTRYILEQCCLEGKKYSETAALLGTTPGMVHKHISKAFAFFRKALEAKKHT